MTGDMWAPNPICATIANEILMHFRAQKKTAGDVSLTEALDLDGEGGGVSLMDVLSVDDERLERLGRVELIEQIRLAVDGLPEREAQVIRLRFGLTGKSPMTQQEVAKSLHISRSYISRIEKRAMEKLRRCFDE